VTRLDATPAQHRGPGRPGGGRPPASHPARAQIIGSCETQVETRDSEMFREIMKNNVDGHGHGDTGGRPLNKADSDSDNLTRELPVS
jgi:hypothetical protein